jgi:hypothetical protein
MTPSKEPGVGWNCYQSIGGRISRICELTSNGRVSKWETLTKENPPIAGEEVFVETLFGITKMKVEVVFYGIGGHLLGKNVVGPMEFFPEDNEWRCLGIANLRSVQKIELKDDK